MKLATFTKQPRERESYTINYSKDLTDGDSIDTATVEVAPPGLLVDECRAINDRVRIWHSAGEDRVAYKVTVLAQTVDGRTLEDEYTVKVKDS